ncbi:hypothetical protein COCMIDRAFT_32378 [Bipolaris oryzae ATCC 44560]|uniref:Rhodopsin domain-containing protein n=1 Tax=Bipolaris oryzae ATCC 44560 TaxID=930090 RepID=W6ZS06_COCMI|nr:uncharacterized protein COCMIDRAFT_32378 [Bipolaris oryzae ATCC 44560]EUC50284.1 hypothetical protein COCMIDRAFT_32378 [Bipolaris oryzae ATCC 44560]
MQLADPAQSYSFIQSNPFLKGITLRMTWHINFSRVKLVRVVGWDNLFVLLSLLCSIIALSSVRYGAVLGFGQHTAVIVAQFGNQRLFKGALIRILGYPSFAVITIALAFTQCRPTQKLWEKSLPGSCWNPNILNSFSYWFCAYTTFTDVVLTVAPACTFWNLQIAWSTKIGLIVMMIWKPVALIIWGLVEQNIVIMAACVPTMRPFFRRTWRCNFSTKPGARSRFLAQDPFTYTKGTRSPLKCQSGSISDVALTHFELHGDRFDQMVHGGIL